MRCWFEDRQCQETDQEVHGRLESLGVAGGDEPVVRVEDDDERADFSERDTMDDDKALPVADDGVHHEVEDCEGDGAALGDVVPRLEGKPVAADGLACCGLSGRSSRCHQKVGSTKSICWDISILRLDTLLEEEEGMKAMAIASPEMNGRYISWSFATKEQILLAC